MRHIFKSVSMLLLGAGLISLASCNNGDEDITGTLKLTRSYTGKTFMNDGIETATLAKCTDGDTSNFKLSSGQTITVRYLGIDTPESTAGYDKWGKAASKWNESILTKATSIVIESNDNNANKDSNGSRYVAFVWYKTSDTQEYRNLNLETLENGFTDYTGSKANVKYDETFVKAKNKAVKAKLRTFGDEEDIYYPSENKTVDLKELNENYDKYYDKEQDIPTHVQFDAYLKEYKCPSNFINLTMAQIIDGKEYEFDITLGYTGNALANLFSKSQEGYLYHISGFTMKEKSIHGLQPSTFLSKGDTKTSCLSSEAVAIRSEYTVKSFELNDKTATITANYKLPKPGDKFEDKEIIIVISDYSGESLTKGQVISGLIYLKENNSYTAYMNNIKVQNK